MSSPIWADILFATRMGKYNARSTDVCNGTKSSTESDDVEDM